MKTADPGQLTDLVRDAVMNGKQIRPFPAAVSQLLSACQDEGATAKTFEKIIECDPALSIRLLRMANSPLSGLADEVRTIAHATSMLGIRQIKSLALCVAGNEIFASGAEKKARQDLWNHSLGCAIVSRELAAFIDGVPADEAFLAGIFHDVGKLLLYDVVPEEYARMVSAYSGAQLVAQEEVVFGMSHAEIGLRSIRQWGMAEDIGVAVGYHHAPQQTTNHRPFASLTHIADSLCRVWGIGSEPNDEFELSSDVVQVLGIESEKMAGLRDQAGEMHRQMADMWS